MIELILSGDAGDICLGENTFVICLDDTGHERFCDANHPVFGLGGCAFMVRDYLRLIEIPWNYMCSRFFPNEPRPLHAADLKCTEEQIEALNHFFSKFEFFRIAALASNKTTKKFEGNFIELIGACILERIADVAKWARFDRMVIIVESCDRIELDILSSIADKKIVNGISGTEVQLELFLLPKSACMPAMELADFIIHTAGGQVRHRNTRGNSFRKDFQVIFKDVDERLSSFMEIVKAQSI